MCLYFCSQCSFKGCTECCSVFWRECCRSCNPCGLIFNVLIGFPAGLFFVLGGGLFAAVVHWVPGTFNQGSAMWKHVCEVIGKGRDIYSNDPSRRRSPSIFDCCAAACAEIYCFLTPIFALFTLVLPFWVLGQLLLLVICDAFSGGCAGCVGTNVGQWWAAVATVLRTLDHSLAASALRPEKAPMLTCCVGQPPLPRERLPSTCATPSQTLPQQAQPARPYASNAPPPPPPPPRNNDPIDQMERAAAAAARDVATAVIGAGVRALISGPPNRGSNQRSSHGAQQQRSSHVQPTYQQQQQVPRAVPVAVPVSGGVSMGRRVA